MACLNLDCIYHMLKYVNDGQFYKSLLLTCKSFYIYYQAGFKLGSVYWNHSDHVRRFSNHLLTLLKIFPKKYWDWDAIARNPNFDTDTIQEHIRRLKIYMTKRSNPIAVSFSWHNLSQNKNLTWDIICNDPFNWDWGILSKNPCITWEIIKSSLYMDWNWRMVSMNPNVTLKIIKDNPSLPWDWNYVSRNPNITWDIVRSHMDRVKWNWGKLSGNTNFHWGIFRDNPDLGWNWDKISARPDVTWEIIREYPGYAWEWTGISRNPNITWDIYKENPDMPWDMFNLSRNPNITPDIIQTNPGITWEWRGVSLNPSITWDFVEANPKRWNWKNLSRNHFGRKYIKNGPKPYGRDGEYSLPAR